MWKKYSAAGGGEWGGGGRMGMTVIWPSKSILYTCDISFQHMSICWIKTELVFFLRKKGHHWYLRLNVHSESKQTQNKLCIATQCVHFWEEEINQSQTSISVCIPLAAHVCQLMKSVHGSPVIDFREVLICRLRSGSSLSLPFSSLSLFPATFFTLLCKRTHTDTQFSSCATQSCLGQSIERWLQQWGNPAGQTV